SVDVLDPLEAFPDSVFVEDPALVFDNGAILLRPGAPSREGERAPMRLALARRFDRVLELRDGEYADGGDVLVTPHTVFIGLSRRTTPRGADALAAHLKSLGRAARIVPTPAGVLHYKTAVSLPGFDIVLTPAGEEAAANALRVNGTVFVGAHYPRTLELLTKRGYKAAPLAISETAKLDAGLSCLSLRW